MKKFTIMSLCACYLDTNYLPVEEMVDAFGYDLEEDLTVEHFRRVMWPMREKWFDLIDSWKNVDSWDLEVYAEKLADKLIKLDKQLKEAR